MRPTGFRCTCARLASVMVLVAACSPGDGPPSQAVDDGSQAPVEATSDGGLVPEAALPVGAAAGGEAGATFDADAPIGFHRPEHVRGIYVNAWAAGSSRRMDDLIGLADRTEVNAFVIDVKDATGYVSYSTGVPLARTVGATGEIRIRDVASLLRRLSAAGIYPVARIVVFKDPLVAGARPDLAIQDSAGGVWKDHKGNVWVNAFQEEVWDYSVRLAREAAELGFPEIQWDYVRFPDAPESAMARARFPGGEGRPRTEAIRSFLAYARDELAELDVAVTADVFGISTMARRDVGIGQVWESFIDQVDVALPMIYPSHYGPGNYGFDNPNAHPYEVVLASLRDARDRSAPVPGAGTTRPWLQDFTLGAPRYGPPEVRAQIQATYDAGLQEWILWNPGSRYQEKALAPEGGWPAGAEPWIRFGGEIILTSERVIPPEPVALETEEADGAGGDDGPATTPPSAGGGAPGPGAPDTVKAPGRKPRQG